MWRARREGDRCGSSRLNADLDRRGREGETVESLAAQLELTLPGLVCVVEDHRRDAAVLGDKDHIPRSERAAQRVPERLGPFFESIAAQEVTGQQSFSCQTIAPAVRGHHRR